MPKGIDDPNTLKPRTQAVLDYIRGYQAEHNYSPSIRNIKEGCGLSSNSVVTWHVQLLSQAGYIERVPGLARTIVVLEK